MDYSFIVIGFVGGAIIVFIIYLLVFKSEKELSVTKTQSVNSQFSDEEIRTKLKALLRSGNKLDAIKFIVKNKNIGLAEGKKLVDLAENLKEDDNIVFKNKEFQNNIPADDYKLFNQVRKLIADGNKIQAIKLVVTNRKMGLKEAKDYIDSMETKYRS